MPNPSFTQVTARARNDDGSESAATWKAAQGTDVTIAVDANFRYRFRIDETAARSWTSLTWNLYYSLNGGAYTAVGAATPIQFALSGNFVDGDDTTTQLTGGTGTFVTNNNGMKETTGGAVNTGAAGDLFEVEFCLKMDSGQLANNNTIALRIYNGTSAIATYTYTPTITVSGVPSPPGSQVSTGNVFGQLGVGNIGPFIDANGNLYLIMSDSTTKYQLEAWKSTDNGSTWSEVDAANKPVHDSANDCVSIDVFQVGSVLHVATWVDSVDDVYYHTFRMSDNANADTWGVKSKLVAAYTNTTFEYGVAIVVQSDGDILILSAGDDGTYFTGRECVEYHYSQDGGTNWTTKQAFLTTDSDNLAQAMALGASNKIHGFGKEEASTRYIHRSLADVTSTPSAIESASAGVTVSGENYVHAKPAVYYDSSGNEKVVFGYLSSTYLPCVTVVTNDGTPANGVQATTTVVHRSLRYFGTTAHVAALSLCKYLTDLYVVFADNATKDIWYVKSANGGTFGSDVEIGDAATVDELSANIYVRSGTIYLGVAWIQGSETSTTVRYLAYSLGSASTTHNATAALAGTSSVVTVGKATIQFSATLAGTSSVTTAGKASIPFAATLSGTSSLTVVGSAPLSFSASLTGSSSVVTAGKIAIPFTASVVGTSSVTTAGRVAILLAASVEGTSSVTAIGIAAMQATASLAGTSSVVTLGKVDIPVTASLVGSSSLIPAGWVTLSFTATVQGTSSITVVGLAGLLASASLQGTSSVTAAGLRTFALTASVSGSSSVITAGFVLLPFAVTLSGTSSLITVGQRIIGITAFMQGTSSVIAAGKNLIPFACLLSGTSTLMVVGQTTGQVDFTANLLGTSGLTVHGSVNLPFAAVLEGTSSVMVIGVRTVAFVASLSGISIAVIAGYCTITFSVAFAGTSTMTAEGSVGLILGRVVTSIQLQGGVQSSTSVYHQAGVGEDSAADLSVFDEV